MDEHDDLVLRDVSDPAVLAAMRKVDRAEFVPAQYREQAYEDHPLPIGHGQTISQPYIVALMTELLGLHGGERVLEVGTGCGYQTAILAELAAAVYSVELIPRLAETAAARLTRLGYANVSVRCADGGEGWPEHAPYDAAIVTAAAPELPGALLEQLREGGVLVAPVGPPGALQVLERCRKLEGRPRREQICTVAFVPLVRP